ncbi:MAG: hypothetical protein ACPGU1_08130 [Myxococcota bacterium]
MSLLRVPTALFAIAVFAACSSEPAELRSAGAICASMDECSSNLCYEAICLEIANDDDLDGLTNEVEIAILGTNPNSADSDNDGRTDGFEVGSDIENPLDEDKDGIPDVHESASPEADQDRDCIPDQKDPQNLVQEEDIEKAAQLACCCYGTCSEAQMAAFEDIKCIELDGIKQFNCLPAEMDTDGDRMGDSCDPCPLDKTNDSDGDGLCDGVDNCDFIADPSNPDICGECPPGTDDIDGDGLCGDDDPCPLYPDPNQTKDGPDDDGDGIPDLCDPCWGTDQDTDNDGVCDTEDLCPGYPSPTNSDADGDGQGDPCDSCHDPDGDTLCGDEDPCPLIPSELTLAMDLDDDGLKEPCVLCTDADGDGFGLVDQMCPPDNCVEEPNPLQLDLDSDGVGDACDPCNDVDDDGTGAGLASESCPVDNCPDEANPEQLDSDGDGQGDLCDSCLDIDADGSCADADCDDDNEEVTACTGGTHCHPDSLICVACLQVSHCPDDGDPCTLTRCEPTEGLCSHEQVDATSSAVDQALATEAGCTCPAVDPVPPLSTEMASTFCGQVCTQVVQCLPQDIHPCHSGCITELIEHGAHYATHACERTIAAVQAQVEASSSLPFPPTLCDEETVESLCRPNGCPLSLSEPCVAFCTAVNDCGDALQAGLPAQPVTSLQRFASLAPEGLCSSSCSGISVGYPSISAQVPLFTDALKANCDPDILATPSAGHPCTHYDPTRCRAWGLPWGGQEQGYLAVYRPQGVSWAEAKVISEALGGHLATLGSEAEDVFIYEQLALLVWAPGSFDGPWIGGHKASSPDELPGTWQWVDGTPWDYTHWAPNQPGVTGEDAAIRYRYEGPQQGSWGWLTEDEDEVSWNTTGFIVEFPFPFVMPYCYDPDNDFLCGTPAEGCAAPEMDTDQDGTCDNDIDNCPETHNPTQLDLDRDGIGNACDLCLDNDDDGVCYEADCNDNSNIVGACGDGTFCDTTSGTCVPCEEGAPCEGCTPVDPDTGLCPIEGEGAGAP